MLVLLAELVFSRLEYRILDNVPEINLYMEYSDKDCLENVLPAPAPEPPEHLEHGDHALGRQRGAQRLRHLRAAPEKGLPHGGAHSENSAH
ncbi:MAG: hypothetical protein ACLR4Z_11145 [Butyricicoccaceae bacterium]